MNKLILAWQQLDKSDRILLFPLGNNYYAFGQCAETISDLTESAVFLYEENAVVEILGEVIENLIRELSGKTEMLVSVVRNCEL